MRKSAESLSPDAVLILAHRVHKSPEHVALARHLAANPGIGRAVARMSPGRAAKEIQRLERSLNDGTAAAPSSKDESMTDFAAAERAKRRTR